MKLTELWSSRQGRPTLSFELFPARTEKARAKLDAVVDELAALGPDFVSVTFGAGGSTREGSLALARHLKIDKGLEVLAYVNGFGLAPSVVGDILEAYADVGVENVLLVRGDPPEEADGFAPHPEAFRHASELIGFARPRFGFCVGAAAYPEGHKEAQSLDADVAWVAHKVARGAEFLVTNYAYDTARYGVREKKLRGAGVAVPVLPGVMPVYSPKMTQNLAALCGATITAPLRDGLAAIDPEDKAAIESFGVAFALGQCRDLLAGGATGLHFYTMDRSSSVARIVERLRGDGLL